MKRVLAVISVILAAIGMLALIIFTSMGENYDKIIESSDENGNIPEKILGNKDTAKVILYEYADYGCTHCAEWNGTINNLVNQYDGKLAVVFRSFDLGYQNGNIVSRAATAAQLQGYWKEFKDIVFEKQEEWFYADSAEINRLLNEYFQYASKNNGNLATFQRDLNSERVKTRVSFENRIGLKIGIEGTPTFRLNGVGISAANLEEKIAEKINKLQ